MKQDKLRIYGKHVLSEALAGAPHVIEHVFLDGSLRGSDIERVVKKAKIPVSVPKQSGSVFKDTENHQGVVAEISRTKLVRPYAEFMQDLNVSADTALLLLGEIQDPNNVGAVIRSAAAFGISGVLIPEHNQAPITGAVIKVSAGMAFRVPLVSIGNVNNTLRDLKAKRFWTYGLDAGGDHALAEESFTEPTAFVLGSEAAGMREKTREECDIILSIPMHPECESLNAGSSVAVAMYEWSKQHPNVLQ